MGCGQLNTRPRHIQWRLLARSNQAPLGAYLRTTALPFLICRREWRDAPVNHSRPCGVASFQSRFVAVGQRTRTNVDCINTEFAGFLALVGFAGQKMS
jgi:hypothetical protein